MEYRYKGYTGVCMIDRKVGVFRGSVVFRDAITFQAVNEHDIQGAFEDAVDDYLSSRNKKPAVGAPFTWNYRVIKHIDKNEDWYDLQEVHYDEDGKIFGFVKVDAIVAHSREGIVGRLEMMLRDVESTRLRTLVDEDIIDE